jgi:hypothetical protein
MPDDDNITSAPIEATADTHVAAPKPRKPGTGFFRPRTAEEKAAATAKIVADYLDAMLEIYEEIFSIPRSPKRPLRPRASTRRRGAP